MRSNRFTLLELMVVVAIIGILAAVAVPSMIQMQHRAKRAEAFPNIRSIMESQFAHDAAFDSYIDAFNAGPEPIPRATADLDKQAVAWVTGTGFDTLGWSPSGEVRCSYGTFTSDPGLNCPAGVASVYGLCDVDDDDQNFVAVRCQDVASTSWPQTLVTPTDY